MDDIEEKVLFQFTMNYKAYRRKAIAVRACFAVVLAAAACGLCALSVLIGILVAAIVLVFGVIAILLSLGNEQTYTVYNTRIVLKRRGSDARKSVPIGSVTAIKYKRAFYEKDLATGTLTVYAKDGKGRTKKYRLRHIFNASAAISYLNGAIAQNGGTNDEHSDEGRE
ncbi:MAG: hypothetical protein NC184_03470 [Roseburia sp.]|nr:hypothetical protein [Roseburia sp.]